MDETEQGPRAVYLCGRNPPIIFRMWSVIHTLVRQTHQMWEVRVQSVLQEENERSPDLWCSLIINRIVESVESNQSDAIQRTGDLGGYPRWDALFVEVMSTFLYLYNFNPFLFLILLVSRLAHHFVQANGTWLVFNIRGQLSHASKLSFKLTLSFFFSSFC